MVRFDKYDVIMRILEIIQSDSTPMHTNISKEQRQKAADVINLIWSDSLLQQIIKEGVMVMKGNEYEDIKGSTIAAGQSTAIGAHAQVINSFNEACRLVEATADITKSLKRKVIRKIGLLEEELRKKEPDAGRIQSIWRWLKKDADWVVPTLTQVVIEGLRRAVA